MKKNIFRSTDLIQALARSFQQQLTRSTHTKIISMTKVLKPSFGEAIKFRHP